ncbi:MAG: TolA colicin import membrane protein [uncultured bacterium]|nr:MAG: TolA colicin import membrane protein [uncultured bacterium]
MAAQLKKKYIYLSLTLHVAIMLILVLSVNFSAPLPVFENTNKQDVISAVVLGDTIKSKILPQKIASQPIKTEPQESKPAPKEIAKIKPIEKIEPKKDVIALKIDQKKKLADKKSLENKQRELLEKSLLADIKTHSEKQKKVKQKQLKSQFEKLLRDSAEKSLRQQLLNEEIKLKGIQNRQAQGEINKYKALIIQAISDHWIIPTQSDKSLYSELMIRVAPGGVVLDVQVTKSSGDPALDSSARAAVLKSSPLPVPADPEAFEAFRQFVLKVKPENILGDAIG